MLNNSQLSNKNKYFSMDIYMLFFGILLSGVIYYPNSVSASDSWFDDKPSGMAYRARKGKSGGILDIFKSDNKKVEEISRNKDERKEVRVSYSQNTRSVAVSPYRHISKVSLFGSLEIENTEGENKKLSDGTIAKAIWLLFTSNEKEVLNDLTVYKDQRDDILEFYEQRNFEPLWVRDFGLTTPAERLIKTLSKSNEDGLDNNEYLPATIKSFDYDPKSINKSKNNLAKLDLEITVAALKYARHISGGRIIPSRVNGDIDIRPDTTKADEVLASLEDNMQPGKYIASLQPKLHIYTQLKKALADYKKKISESNQFIIPHGPIIRVGNRDSRISLIKKRLISLGYDIKLNKLYKYTGKTPLHISAQLLTPELTKVDDDLYDVSVYKVLKEFQKENRLRVDGIIGRSTIVSLNGDLAKYKSKVEKIILNMERARWLPDNLGNRHIFVNQPEFGLKLVDNGKVIHRAKVIIGKRKYKTPVFNDFMEYIVLNPYWGVPRSIATKEMLPKLVNNPDYLDKRNFQIVNSRGRIVDSYSVDWEEYTDRAIPFTFRQKPGRRNALGVVKFIFPNRHSIYLHDTPTKSLFSRKVRAFSHGCIRVHKAEKLAKIILGLQGWSDNRVSSAVRSGKNRTVHLQKKIPVYLTYFTALPGEGGKISFYRDIYGRDHALARAMRSVDLLKIAELGFKKRKTR